MTDRGGRVLYFSSGLDGGKGLVCHTWIVKHTVGRGVECNFGSSLHGRKDRKVAD